MRFTEGFWVASETAHPHYAMQVYDAWEIEGGMRVLVACGVIRNRADTLNMPAITVEFTSPAEDVIEVKSWHYEGYEKREPRFQKYGQAQPVLVSIDENEAVMTAGRVCVRVNRQAWGYQFEAEGKVITSCGYKGLAYMQQDRQPSTVLPHSNYLSEVCSPYMVTDLSLQAGECIYGLGERFSSFVKNGQSLDTWNEDGGTASQIAYKCIPFYMSNKGYGLLADHSDNVSFEIASEKVSYIGISAPGEMLRYQWIYGPSPKEIVRRYTAFTGRPALPPAWSFGLWLSTSFTTNYDEKTANSFIDGMTERDIPTRVFHIDCFWMKGFHWCDFEWDADTFPDPAGMLKRYKEKGLKICVWINPYIAQGTPFFAEGMENGYLLMRSDGKGVKQTDFWQNGMAWVDFTNPAACKWYTDKLKTLLDIGVDCFKTDFGERIPIDVTYHDGSDPSGMHNYYTFLYNQQVFDLLKREKGEAEAVLFARSATVGSQQFPVHWGGDSSANYASMAETLRGGLSFALSGFSFWSHDISGFEQTATPDVYKRWIAFGLLSTHSRLHGSTSYRVPWLFDDEASEVLRFFTQLKCTLMPYLYRTSMVSRDEGIPVMRPMMMEFPQEYATQYLDMQYMLGDNLLVAPIFSEDGKTDYYLPKGTWTHLLTGETREGGQWYQDTYDYFSLPLYVRENTFMAIGQNKQLPDYDYTAGTALHLYRLADGETAVCEIPTTQGTVALRAEATRTGNTVSFSFSNPPVDIHIVLHGMGQPDQFQNMEPSSGGKNTLIYPKSQQCSLILS